MYLPSRWLRRNHIVRLLLLPSIIVVELYAAPFSSPELRRNGETRDRDSIHLHIQGLCGFCARDFLCVFEDLFARLMTRGLETGRERKRSVPLLLLQVPAGTDWCC